jgi:hypothetical protein
MIVEFIGISSCGGIVIDLLEKKKAPGLALEDFKISP